MRGRCVYESREQPHQPNIFDESRNGVASPRQHSSLAPRPPPFAHRAAACAARTAVARLAATAPCGAAAPAWGQVRAFAATPLRAGISPVTRRGRSSSSAACGAGDRVQPAPPRPARLRAVGRPRKLRAGARLEGPALAQRALGAEHATVRARSGGDTRSAPALTCGAGLLSTSPSRGWPRALSSPSLACGRRATLACRCFCMPWCATLVGERLRRLALSLRRRSAGLPAAAARRAAALRR